MKRYACIVALAIMSLWLPSAHGQTWAEHGSAEVSLVPFASFVSQINSGASSIPLFSHTVRGNVTFVASDGTTTEAAGAYTVFISLVKDGAFYQISASIRDARGDDVQAPVVLTTTDLPVGAQCRTQQIP